MLKPGDNVERYTVESILGEGGMGSVYRAHDERLERHVALKVVRIDGDGDAASRKESTARLVREARAAAKLDHPNAVSIFDVGELDGTAFIAMELVPGRTMRAILTETPPPKTADRVRWLVDVARALSAAHRAGIVHRDVKPENVMVRPDGVVKVLDFGIARRAAREVDPSAPTEEGTIATLTAAGVHVGTPAYMAPEQIKGDALDGRADQFAWGVLAYELLTGKSPWDHKNDALALAAAILTQPLKPVRSGCPDVSEAFERVVARSVSKAADERFASMDALLAELADEPGSGYGAAPRAASNSVPPAMEHATARSQSKPPAAPEPGKPTSSGRAGRAVDFARYSTQTVRAIVERALERQGAEPEPGYAADEVLAAAREVGVDDETLRAAARDVAERRTRELAILDAKAQAKRKLLRHAATYAVVNTFLLIMFGWADVTKWTLIGWGFGLALSAVRYAFPVDPDEKKLRRKRKLQQVAAVFKQATPDKAAPAVAHPAAASGGVDERELMRAVDALLLTTAARHERVRVASPAVAAREEHLEHERLAEAEAEADAAAAVVRARR